MKKKILKYIFCEIPTEQTLYEGAELFNAHQVHDFSAHQVHDFSAHQVHDFRTYFGTERQTERPIHVVTDSCVILILCDWHEGMVDKFEGMLV